MPQQREWYSPVMHPRIAKIERAGDDRSGVQRPGFGFVVGQTFLVIAAFLLSCQAIASGFGRNGFSGNPGTNGGVICTACHAPAAPVPSLKLSGPEVVTAGETYVYQLEIEGGPGVTAGANLSVSDFAGELLAVDGRLHRIGEELSHTAPAPFAGQRVTYRFRWTAPLYNASLTLYAAANSSNGELDLLGDGIGTDTLAITVENGNASPPQPPAVPAAVKPVAFATGLANPVAIAHAGDERLFVAEQAGVVRSIDASGAVAATPFLDIRSSVQDAGNEQGLLGLAFHPNYTENGEFFVYYTTDPGPGSDRSRVSRFRVSANPARADPGSEQVLLEFEQPYANHNAGDLHFGPDGYLYIASGDGGSGGDPRNFAQNPSSLLGKLLRIDVDSGAGNGSDCNLANNGQYRIPADNAYTDGSGGRGCDEIYASGLRNPWRFSFDRQTGDLWLADVGQNAREEIDFVPTGSGGGLNFGWRCFEGDARYSGDPCDAVYVPPLWVLDHADGDCSITGGYRYRGFEFPVLYGRYFFSDYCNSAIRTLTPAAGALKEDTVTGAGTINTPAAFGENAVGELFLASLSSDTIYRLEAADEGTVVGEAGSATVSQPDGDYWHSVPFRNRYVWPVVVAGPPTANGPGPATLRVRNVTATGFEFQIDEWQYQDGAHVTEAVGYLVVEAGSHTLMDGTRLTAGITLADHEWEAVRFPQPFADTPAVLVTTSSDVGKAAVTERLQAVGPSGFEVKLQEEQGADGWHTRERLSWIALEVATGARQEVGITAPVVDHTGVVLPLARGFNAPPAVLGDLQTYRGTDPASLRITVRSSSMVGMRAEEERSLDAEILHLPEKAGYAAFKLGDLRARQASAR